MKKWVLKAIIQKLISFLPGSHRINFWFQKYVTKGVNMNDSYLGDKLVHAEDHLRFAQSLGGLKDKTSLELGTGWYPVVPLSLFLAGIEKTVSIDLSPLMNKEAIWQTIEAMRSWQKAGKLNGFQQYWQEDRLAFFMQADFKAMELEEILDSLHFEYRVGDARQLKDPADSFDLIHSNNVFEHIYPQILKEILKEFKRVLKKGGLMSHFIDMSDHFAHLDSSITIYNFLSYSESSWRRIDNSVQPQNRMRLSDYETLYQELGLDIKEREFRAGEPEKLKQVQLAPPFAGRSIKELAISHAHLVSH